MSGVTPNPFTQMKLKHICCITVLATLATTAYTNAQDLSAKYLGIDPGSSVKGTFDGTNFRFIQSGLVQFEGFEAFCVEPTQGISINEVIDYDIAFTYSSPEATESIAKLVGNFYSSGQTASEAAATQWAIWEVVIDGSGGSLFSGSAQVDNTAIGHLANSYLGQLPTLPAADVEFLTNPKRQDMVRLVPEPASASLFALASLLLFRRRR
jgi:hypothetical protein